MLIPCRMFNLSMLIVVLLVSCAMRPSFAQAAPQEPASTQPTPQEPASSPEADWLSKMLERESRPLPIVDVAADDGFFTARVPAELLEPVGMVDGARHLMLDFGAGAENLAECYVYSEDLDLAGSLMSFSDSVFEAINKHHGTVELKAVLDVTAGAIDGSPYLGIDWLYRCHTESGTVAGQAKHLIASNNRHAIYCQSSSVGYSKAFFGLFHALVESIEYKQTQPEPYYREISVATLGEHVLGVSHQAHRIDGDGDVEVVEKLSMLVPMADGQSFQAEDSVTMEYSKLDGELIGQVEVEAADGQIVSHLNLARFENGAWAVKGGFRGKNINTILSTAPDLRSSFGRRLDFQELSKTAEAGSTWTEHVWVPEIDPVKLLQTRGTLLSNQAQGINVKLETGPKVMSGLTDPTFSLTFLTVPVGGMEMILRRVHRDGDVFHPTTLEPTAPSVDGTPTSDPTPGSESGS